MMWFGFSFLESLFFLSVAELSMLLPQTIPYAYAYTYRTGYSGPPSHRPIDNLHQNQLQPSPIPIRPQALFPSLPPSTSSHFYVADMLVSDRDSVWITAKPHIMTSTPHTKQTCVLRLAAHCCQLSSLFAESTVYLLVPTQMYRSDS